MSWNPDADLAYAAKQEVIRSYFERYRLGVVIETGLYAGHGSCFQFLGAASVIAVDSDEDTCRMARHSYPTASVVCADSAVYLRELLVTGRRTAGNVQVVWTLDVPAFFWLDAHVVTAEIAENYSPLVGELDAILAWPHAAQSVVLIDDVRMMGLPGWPTLEQVRAKVGETWAREERDDIMRLTPR